MSSKTVEKFIPRIVNVFLVHLRPISLHGVALSFFLEPIHIAWVLSIFGFNPEYFAYWVKRSRTFFSESIVPSIIIVVSSAYWLILNSLSPIFIPFISLSVLISIASISAHNINRYGEIGSPLVSCFNNLAYI